MSARPPSPRRGGFTLIEILVAVLILATAFTIIWTTFSVSLSGWRKGQVALDRLHHGDFVIEQLVAAMRSAAFFSSRPDKYGFWLENKGSQDEISWVTSASAFMKPDDPLARGLHRLWVGIEANEDGEDAFAVRAYPHFAQDIEADDIDPWFISSRVKALDCKIWDADTETWDDEWEDTNAVPALVRVELTLEPLARGEREIKVVRMVEIPVGPATTGAAARAQSPAPAGGETPAPAGEAPNASGTVRPAPSQAQGTPAPGAGGTAP